jgi:hypothetical protein
MVAITRKGVYIVPDVVRKRLLLVARVANQCLHTQGKPRIIDRDVTLRTQVLKQPSYKLTVAHDASRGWKIQKSAVWGHLPHPSK